MKPETPMRFWGQTANHKIPQPQHHDVALKAAIATHDQGIHRSERDKRYVLSRDSLTVRCDFYVFSPPFAI